MALRKWVVDGQLGLWEAGPGREYAPSGTAAGERVLCRAQGLGGRIDVECPSANGGVLKVVENFHADWRASLDGRPAPVEVDGPWLALRVPAGGHRVQLRFAFRGTRPSGSRSRSRAGCSESFWRCVARMRRSPLRAVTAGAS